MIFLNRAPVYRPATIIVLSASGGKSTKKESVWTVTACNLLLKVAQNGSLVTKAVGSGNGMAIKNSSSIGQMMGRRFVALEWISLEDLDQVLKTQTTISSHPFHAQR